MPYDRVLADRIHAVLACEPDLTTQAMFGGLAFLLGGHLAITASNDGGLLVRVGRDTVEQLVATTDAEPAVMGTRTMRDWVRVAAAHVHTERQLARWVELSRTHARTLPAKDSTKRQRTR